MTMLILLCCGFAHQPDRPSPPPPTLELSPDVYPESVASEEAYLQWLDEQLQSDPALANRDRSAAGRSYRANWLVAVRCEPHGTRLLLGMHRLADLQALETFAEEALELLQDLEINRSSEFRHQDQLEIVRSFAKAIAAAAQAARGRPDEAALDHAANELAIWLDDDREEVAAAALLWQSLLYEASGKTDRALDALPPDMTAGQSTRLGLFVRIRRCTLLAAMGRVVLAQSLMLQLEERCAQWFSDETIQHQAQCTLTWLRLATINSRVGRLRPFSEQLLDGIRKRATEFLQDEDSPCSAIRLQTLLPLVFEAPDRSAQPTPPADPLPSSQPAYPVAPSSQ